ncbi:potassium/proton antiporter, CPA1 family [Neorhodopirellula lusitana]|uniref:Potassium/proton antiporter, CPA1 family n=1 Tax=Neorhodopirellula lusitana TaxID=445327 RepID=A0ABY1QBB2_9BACT|nr:potassium/proton antiporter [Neorhodopirellula lusitana]SMP64227.1 potassium/proton antiporter, CPA1 family [Neorhodopirellula lusitana]
MFSIETIILLTGILLLLGIASNKFSSRMGVPVLFIFLIVGMLAGSEGIGGIEFENYFVAHGIGTVALCLILFDGGIRTPYSSIMSAWKPAGVLATVGVFITAVITGAAASWILDLPLLEGMLLGGIVGSTDASVVFSVLRNGGVNIRPKLASTLEVESGSNDPMAIFLTIGLIQVLTGEVPVGIGLATLFFKQVILGTLIGLGVGLGGAWTLKNIRLDAAGLYPVMATALALFSFGLTDTLGGSGFLAVYLTGVVIGNKRPVFYRGILLFQDAIAWLCQILMFIALGILSFPSRLVEIAVPGLLISIVLIFIARPLAVFLCAAPFKFSVRELTFLSWVGLKGAVPITLATFPMLAGLPGASMIFDAVFFVVLVSALVQGWTVPAMARYLDLEVPSRLPPPVSLEITSLRDVDGDIVDYYVDEDCQAANCMIKNLALPDGVVIALIVRGENIIPPQGRSVLRKGDHAMVVLRLEVRAMVDRIFSQRSQNNDALPAALEFPLRGSIRVSDLEQFYGLVLDENKDATLDELTRARLGPDGLALGAVVHFDQVDLHVREISAEGIIEFVGMTITSPQGSDVS